jgi:hypothetical protein
MRWLPHNWSRLPTHHPHRVQLRFNNADRVQLRLNNSDRVQLPLQFAMSVFYCGKTPLLLHFARALKRSEFSYQSRNHLGLEDFTTTPSSGPRRAISVRDGRHIWS